MLFRSVDPSVRVPIIGILKNLVCLSLQNCCVDLIHWFYLLFLGLLCSVFFFNILSPSNIILFIDGDSIYSIIMIDLILISINLLIIIIFFDILLSLYLRHDHTVPL